MFFIVVVVVVSFFFHFISFHYAPGTVLIPRWHTVEQWVFYYLFWCSIFTAGHIHYVSKVLALILYKHSYIVVRDCFQMKCLGLRQIKSLFSRSDSYQCCWNQLVCLIHNEAKQTERLELGVGEDFTGGPWKEKGRLLPKDVNSLMIFQEDFYRTKLGGGTAGCVTLVWLVGGCVPGISMISLLVLISLEFRSLS